ncbi:ATP-binding protein [Streptomyces sp. CA-250714]|uniref:ATP-binding protein n=1 Tax=Streptomyces sp. CA-250714 TaxID=3240060 RepID=UPI003D9405DB
MFVQRFSATRRGARLARLLALHQFDAWGLPYGSERSENAALIVAELAANAVLHGRVPGRDFELALSVPSPGALLIEVTDTRGEAAPIPSAEPGLCQESGRGLLLVAALATSWGVRQRTPGKTVWARCSA